MSSEDKVKLPTPPRADRPAQPEDPLTQRQKPPLRGDDAVEQAAHQRRQRLPVQQQPRTAPREPRSTPIHRGTSAQTSQGRTSSGSRSTCQTWPPASNDYEFWSIHEAVMDEAQSRDTDLRDQGVYEPEDLDSAFPRGRKGRKGKGKGKGKGRSKGKSKSRSPPRRRSRSRVPGTRRPA